MQINELITALNFKIDVAGIRKFDASLETMKREAISHTSAMGKAYNKFAYGSSKVWRDEQGKMRDESGRFVGKVKRDWMGLKSSSKSIFGSIAHTMAHLGHMGFEKLAQGAEWAGHHIFEIGKETERLKASLKTFTGNDDSANTIFNQMDTFSRQTPYRMAQLVKSNLQLQRMGMSGDADSLRAYGNMTEGTDIERTVKAWTSAKMGKYMALKQFGIQSHVFGDEVDFTYQDKNKKWITQTLKRDGDEIEKFAMKYGKEKFMGGVENQMHTIGGAISTLQDNLESFGRIIWTGEVQKNAADMVNWLVEITLAMRPVAQKWVPIITKQIVEFGNKAIKFGKEAWPKIIQGFDYLKNNWPAIQEVLKAAGAAFLLMAFDANAAAIAATLMNIATLAIPIAIGAAIAAVIWFGMQVYKYMTGGEKAIAGVRKQFPWLAEAIRWCGHAVKWLWPILKATGNFIWRFLVLTFKAVWEVLKFFWYNVAEPIFKVFVAAIQEVGKWLGTAYDFWMPKLVTSFYYWKTALEDLAKFLEPWFDKLFGWLSKAKDMAGGTFDAVGKFAGVAVDGVGGLFGGGAVDAGLMGSGDPALQSSLVDFSRTIHAVRGACYNDIWRVQQAALHGTSKLQGIPAADGPRYMDQDSRFQKVHLTQAQIMSGQFDKILHGAQVFYDRQAGFNPVYGHTEVLDMKNHTTNFGIGAIPLSQRTAQNWAHATIYVVKGKGTIPNINNSQGGAAGGVIIQQQQHFHGPANPAQVKQAQQDGTSKALSQAGMSRPKVVSPNR